MIKSRIAPTPSGLLHQGNALNFLLTNHLVRQDRGTLRLRIDDLDAPRVRPEYLQDIFDVLEWLGIGWEEGPISLPDQVANFRQDLRRPRYQDLLERLRASNRVFACICTRKEILSISKDGRYPGTCRLRGLPLDYPDASWRLHIPQGAVIRFSDALLGNVSIDLHEMAGDTVVRRRDGLPAYHLASLADDVDYDINTIVRGEDLLLSTAVQLYLAQLLILPVFDKVCFYHHPLIKDASGAKLSKSAGSKSIRHLRAQGMSRQDFLQEFNRWQRAIISGS